jgi:L-fuconolactonase
MSKNDDWLSLTREEIIEPNLPISDAHHHLRRYGEQTYLLPDFLNDVSQGHRIIQTVVIESIFNRKAGPESQIDPVEEIKYFLSEIRKTPLHIDVAAGIVGYADLSLGEAVAEVLEAHISAGGNRFRGIRLMLGKVPGSNLSKTEDLFLDSNFLRGLATLQKYRLSFDLLVRHHQLISVVQLANKFPDTPIIINHIGCPHFDGQGEKRDETLDQWKKGISVLAELPNVYIKLGGLGMDWFGFGWDKQVIPPNSAVLANAMAPYYLFCIEKFGSRRCMFESNFPVDKRSYSYHILWNAFKEITRNFSGDERLWLFHNTAATIYKLKKAEISSEIKRSQSDCP